MKRAAAYIRVSTADQTLEGQAAELAAYCQARGWAVTMYQDVQSGAAVTRPGLEALMRAVRRRQVDVVVTVKIDRLGRSLSHFAAILHELQSLGVGLVCVSQGIDTVAEPGRLNPAAHFFVTVLAAVAEFERELIRERTRDGLKAGAARRGQVLMFNVLLEYALGLDPRAVATSGLPEIGVVATDADPMGSGRCLLHAMLPD